MAASDPTDIPARVPEERVDELYGLPFDEFTSARDALAKEVRKEGRRAEADWVKRLRKPSAAAWVVNQLARTQGKEAERLVEAGDELHGAQERLLAGDGSADELRRAAERRDEAVDALLASAPGLLDRDGHSPSGSTVEKAGETLRAVGLDRRAREEFAAGRLTREHRATGLGPIAEGAAAAPAPRRATGKGGKPDDDGRRRRSEERAAARRALKEAKAEHRERSRAVTGAERELDRAHREAERAQRRLEEATSALEKARAAEDEAQARVAEAEDAVDRLAR